MFKNSVIVCAIIVLIGPTLFGVGECKQKVRNYLLNKPQCSEKNLHKIELVVARAAVLGPNGRKFPENLTQLKAFCKETAKLVNQVETFFKDCYEKTVRDYANIILYTIKSNLRKYCGKQSTRVVKQLLTLAPCANKHVREDVCIEQFTNQTSQLINISDDKKKIAYVCCYYVEGVRCAEDIMYKIPCIRAHVPALLDLFRAGGANMIDLMCGEYNDQTDSCQRLGPPPKPVQPNRTKYFTFVFVLIDLLESIKDIEAPGGIQ